MIVKAMRSTMTSICVTLGALLGMGLTAKAGPNEPKPAPALRLLLLEDQPGVMSNQQYCMLVFSDRHFHAEKAVRKMGRDQDRKVYEGELPESDWNALESILGSEEFRSLNVPASAMPPVVEDAHGYTISVARDHTFQNMEFLDNKSRKPYESRLKPLLQWWKSIRSRRLLETGAQNSRCSLNSGVVFSY
jgi:hypothetical protein